MVIAGFLGVPALGAALGDAFQLLFVAFCAFKFVRWLVPVLLPLCFRWAHRGALLGAFLYALRVLRSNFLRMEWYEFFQFICCSKDVTCVICTEQVKDTPWRLARLQCCGGALCWNCLRKHAESVIDDARPEMLCPFFHCKRVLPDVVVAKAFQRERWSCWRSLDCTGSTCRRKTRTYDQWSLNTGIAAACRARMEEPVHCPVGACGHAWVTPKEVRRRKSGSEPQHAWNPRAWMIARQAGFYTPPMGDDGDLRKVNCPKCKGSFCLLCHRTWGSTLYGPRHRVLQVSHEGMTCVEYGSCFTEKYHHGQFGGAKPCPGCGIRILRTAGCNHMTCTQCGEQWCWVCQSSWSPAHYGCPESDAGCGLL